MAMPFIFERTRSGGGEGSPRRIVGRWVRGAAEFLAFSVVALAVLIAIAAVRVVMFLH